MTRKEIEKSWLSPVEKMVLIMRLGLVKGDKTKYSFVKIGKFIKKSPSRTSQIFYTAEQRIKEVGNEFRTVGFSSYISNLLIYNNIITIKELKEKSDGELLSIDGLGETILKKIRAVCNGNSERNKIETRIKIINFASRRVKPLHFKLWKMLTDAVEKGHITVEEKRECLIHFTFIKK